MFCFVLLSHLGSNSYSNSDPFILYLPKVMTGLFGDLITCCTGGREGQNMLQQFSIAILILLLRESLVTVMRAASVLHYSRFIFMLGEGRVYQNFFFTCFLEGRRFFFNFLYTLLVLKTNLQRRQIINSQEQL